MNKAPWIDLPKKSPSWVQRELGCGLWLGVVFRFYILLGIGVLSLSHQPNLLLPSLPLFSHHISFCINSPCSPPLPPPPNLLLNAKDDRQKAVFLLLPPAVTRWPSLWSSTAFLNCISKRSSLNFTCMSRCSSIKLWETAERGQQRAAWLVASTSSVGRCVMPREKYKSTCMHQSRRCSLFCLQQLVIS